MKLYIYVVFGLMLFVFGLLIGKFIFSQNAPVCTQTFAYVNPKLNCGDTQTISKANPIDLKAKLTTFIADEKGIGRAEEVAVYFRDLHDGPVLGINENKEFVSASLLKLPIAMTLYRFAEEEQPKVLSAELKFEEVNQEHVVFDQYYTSPVTIRPNIYYPIEELIYNSLAYSDNLSNNVLKNALQSVAPERNLLFETYRDLGLVPTSGVNQADLSTRLYSTIFRILYNASYLSTEHSEKILSILATSTFDEGIAAGVPKDVMVANKFGERSFETTKQLHDCGIIYFPQNPYLLCVMTRGKDYSVLSGVIRQISAMVYENISAKRLP